MGLNNFITTAKVSMMWRHAAGLEMGAGVEEMDACVVGRKAERGSSLPTVPQRPG